MPTHVDTVLVEIEDFYPKLYVQSFELTAALNTIPSISLSVLPIEAPTRGDGQYVTATAPTVQDITSLYSDLLRLSLSLEATATIHIALHCHKPDLDEFMDIEYGQDVILEDWILTDVGLSTVTPSAAPVLTVIFSHPVVKLDRTGSIYETIKNKGNLAKTFKTLPGSEPIAYMDALYKVYSGGGKLMFYDIAQKSLGGPRGIDKTKVQKFRSRLAEYPPGKYIEGHTEKLFLANVAESLIGNIRMATGYMLMPQAFGESTWSRLVRTLGPSFLTQIVPTYDRPKLSLEPYSPWQYSSRTINTNVVEAIDMVSADPAPIIGTAVTKAADTSTHTVDGSNRAYTGSKSYDYTHAFYFPENGAAKANDFGEVMGLGEPRIVSYIIDMDRSANATVGGSGPKGPNLERAGNGVSDMQRETMNEAYAKAMFLINYRKGCRASVTTTLLFKDSAGLMLYPGRVLTVYDKSDQLFNGFITRITIKGSAEGGGSTAIEMSHARPPDPDSVLVEEGTENPCYPPIPRDTIDMP